MTSSMLESTGQTSSEKTFHAALLESLCHNMQKWMPTQASLESLQHCVDHALVCVSPLQWQMSLDR